MPGVNPQVWTLDIFYYQDHVIGVPAMEGQRREYQRVGEGFDNLTWYLNYPELNHRTLILNSRGNTICPREVRQIREWGDKKLDNKAYPGGNDVDKFIRRRMSEGMRPADKLFRRMSAVLRHKRVVFHIL